MQNASTDPQTAVSNPNRQRLIMLILIGALIAIFLLSLFVGSVRIPLNDILHVLTGGAAQKEAWTIIVLKFRLPKAITAVLAG
ncbi:Vitamin B12 ABC transporter, permease component BtuC, partial [hydrothermal vent metagenome]